METPELAPSKLEGLVRRRQEEARGRVGVPVELPELPGWRTQPQRVEDIPNYDRLTRTERWVMDRLPGFAESSVGKALAAFGESWAGRALSYLDVPAEGLERATGLAAQYLTTIGDEAASNDFRENLNAAWYAGSLAGDMANLPQIREGRWFLPDDLPGVAGLVRSRQQIARLMAQGVDPGDALVQVRDQFYEDQGALALRSQLQDTMFHVVADPLNVILPYLKPVERLSAVRRALLSNRATAVAVEAAERDVVLIGRVIDDLEDAAHGANVDSVAATVERLTSALDPTQEAEDLATLARVDAKLAEIQRGGVAVNEAGQTIAGTSTPVSGAVSTFRRVPSAVRRGGITDEAFLWSNMDNGQKQALRAVLGSDEAAQRFLGRMVVAPGGENASLREAAQSVLDLVRAKAPQEKIEEALEEVRQFQRGAQMAVRTPLRPLEERFLRLTGGIPGEPQRRLPFPFNAFQLTPRSRAYEYMNTILDSVGAYLFGRRITDADSIVRWIGRAADGMLGPEFGHMITTYEGRAVRAALQGIRAEAVHLLGGFNQVADERNLLQMMSRVMGEVDAAVLQRILDGEGAAVRTQFLERLAQAADPQAAQLELATLLQRMGLPALTDETVGSLAQIFKGNLMYSLEGFQHELLLAIINRVGKQAIVQFGLKHEGMIGQIAGAMKAAETLAFLKINPSYPIRNGVNNIFTSVARGTWSVTPGSVLETIWKRVGFEPPRLRAGAGPAEVLRTGVEGEKAGARALSAGAQILRDAEEGKVGWLNRFMDWAQERRGLGFGDMAQQFEAKASFRAYTASYIKGWRQYYWRENVTYKLLDDFDADLAARIAEIDPTIGPALRNLFKGVLSEAEIDAGLVSDNLRLTVGNLVAEAEQRTGMRIGKILTDDFMASIEPRMQAAVQKGRQATVEFFDGLGEEIEKALDDALDEAFKTVRDETAARVEAEGPGAFVHLWGDTMDEFYGAHEKHAMEVSRIVQSIRANEDPRITHGLWRQFMSSSDRFYARSWQRLEARFDGMVQAAKKLGLPHGDEIMGQFRSWRDGWRQFFEFRAKTWDDFFQARLDGKAYHRTFEQIADDLDTKYAGLLNREDSIVNQIDRTVAGMLPQEQRRLFMAWRDRVAAFRRSDREMVLAFRRQVRDLSPRLANEAWENHWRQRLQNFSRIAQEERAGAAAMQGSREAVGYYQGAVAEIEEGLELLTRQVAGETLGPEEKAKVFDFIRRHTFPEEAERLRRISEAENVATGQLTATQFLQQRGAKAIEDVRIIDMPDQIREQVIGVLENWYQQIAAGQPGYRVFDTSGPGIDVTGVGSGYPSWYGKFLEEFNTDKKAVVEALDRLRSGEERGTRAMIRRFKEFALNEIVNGPEIADIVYPPDPAVLRFFERPAEEIQEAIARWASEQGVDLGQFAQTTRLTEQKKIQDAIVRRLTTETHFRFVGPGLDEVLTEGEIQRRIEDISRILDETVGAGPRKPTDIVRVAYTDAEGKVAFREFTREAAERARMAYSEVGPSPKKRVFLYGERTTVEDLQRRLSAYRAVLEPTPAPEGVTRPTHYLPDFHAFVPRQLVDSTGIDQLWYTRGDEALRGLREAALDQIDRPPLRFSQLPQDLQTRLRGYIDYVKGSMSDARYAATRFAEYGRDSALLNYNRRFNYNTWLGTAMPYEFWLTQNAFKWALHSIDRPAMLTSYLRFKKLLETGYRPEEGLPARLRGKIRIDLPFLPDWMGDQFIDPMRTALPFDTFAYPFEEAAAQAKRDEGAAERVLRELLNDGRISQEDYDEALATKAGPAWERAVVLARQDDTEGRLNGFDFAALFSAPHAPLMWAYNALRGEPERIGPFTPLERTIAGVQGMFGISPSGGLNSVSAAVRRQLGLPAFDQWEDYRIDRMLSNLAATGDITTQDALRAMIERSGTAFELARRRAAQEFSVTALGSTIGIPTNAYPQGEEFLRSIKDEYEAAWAAYEAGDTEAVNRFYTTYPDYETRLALFKKPQERLQAFLVDEMWDRWNELPALHRSEAQDQLGELFQRAFLDKETRSYESIPVEVMGVWLKLLGGDPPGTLNPAQGIPPIEFAPAEVANRAQVFYEMRNRLYPSWFEQQERYYQLDEGAARRQYRRAHRDFEEYRSWRIDFLLRNPDVAPYLTDNPPTYRSEVELRQALEAQPSFTRDEWRQMMGPSLYELVLDLAVDGEALPAVAIDSLEDMAQELGTTVEQIVGQFEGQPVAP